MPHATHPNPMTPHDFIAKWGAPDGVPGPAYALNEEQGAQNCLVIQLLPDQESFFL